ncbi:MAG TPA: AraC family transcriptional regulator [Gemmataceae bacterium]|nr:AraC family transcriptional regulator [Gemmataceae bacterium]
MRADKKVEAGLSGPLELLKHLPGEAFASSERLRCLGLEAFRYRNQPPNEAFVPPLTHHSLLLFLHAPKEFGCRCADINRVVPPPAGSILVVPAGSPAWYRWGSHSDSLHVFLEAGLVARVAEEAFGLDSALGSLPPLDGLHLPQLRAAMLAVNDELTADSDGGRLAVESLANIMAVHLIRNVSAPRRLGSRNDAPLPQRKLRAVVEYVEEHLDSALTLEQLAVAVHLSPYHFARQFKAATGTPPHQYVIARRVERARQLLREGDFSLSAVAVHAGFSDQSQFSRHFKRLTGASPRQFRISARNA